MQLRTFDTFQLILGKQEGYDTNCTEFRDVSKGFTWSVPLTTCRKAQALTYLASEDVLVLFDLTLAQFSKMNPAVGSTCANLWTGETTFIPWKLSRMLIEEQKRHTASSRPIPHRPLRALVQPPLPLAVQLHRDLGHQRTLDSLQTVFDGT